MTIFEAIWRMGAGGLHSLWSPSREPARSFAVKTPREEQRYETFLCGRSRFDDNGEY